MEQRRRRVPAALPVAIAVVTAAVVGCGSTGGHSSVAAPSTEPRPVAPTTRPESTSAPQSPLDPRGLVELASRYRTTCRGPGAAIGALSGDGVPVVVADGESIPGRPLSVDDSFLAGSVTKLFVAVVAYQLISAGTISLGDTVADYLADWPAGDRITIDMLLGHRSGMGDFGNDFSAELRDRVLADLSRAYPYGEVMELVRSVPPAAEPGLEYHYSNANYIVLGAILQQVTGASLGTLIDERIVAPLDLRDTFYGPDDIARSNAVSFHGLFDLGDGRPIDIGGLDRTAALTIDPAGAGMFSTVPELLAFGRALFATDALLARSQREQLIDDVATIDNASLLLPDRFDAHGHGGASPGAQAVLVDDRAHDVTVAVWCNRLDPGPGELLPSVGAAAEALLLVSDRSTAG